ncbi:MAG: autoinducer 2 ABC transporter substrate-binding protein [Actinomycetaceae bacterium]|nr:autoinducer 2 ABC transporter substrate-binding protein [Actinomycetaceae bacterium]
MKIKRLLSVFAAGTVALSLALTGCADGKAKSENTGDNSSGGKKVAFVPKIQGIPFFEAMNRGGEDAAKDGNFEWVYKGATTADPAAQADVVRSLIQQKVDALIVAPNDPDSMAPLLKQAQDAGIHVLTADTDAPDSVREAFVNQASEEGIGKALVDELVKPMGDEGEIAIVSCGQTAANLNAWIDVAKKYVEADLPKIKIVDVVYADEDEDKAVTMAKNLMNAHPNLKGLIGPCTTAAPGIARAVDETNNIGKVYTVGVGTPKAMAPYLESGASSASVLWDVENAGYLAAWVGNQLASDKPLEASMEAGRIGTVKYDDASKVVLLGDPLILTKDNVGNYDY